MSEHQKAKASLRAVVAAARARDALLKQTDWWVPRHGWTKFVNELHKTHYLDVQHALDCLTDDEKVRVAEMTPAHRMATYMMLQRIAYGHYEALYWAAAIAGGPYPDHSDEELAHTSPEAAQRTMQGEPLMEAMMTLNREAKQRGPVVFVNAEMPVSAPTGKEVITDFSGSPL